jgi:hypothetical protein
MRRLRLVSILLMVCAMGFGACLPCGAQPLAAGAGAAGNGGHPEIRKALAALNLAAVDLENAADDFCGHKADALTAVNTAITQLGLAIQCDSGSSAAAAELNQTLAGLRSQINASPAAAAKGHYPLIRQAIAACEIAANALDNAAHDYCGHRFDALEATLAAIDELNLAISCANK